MDSWKSIVGTVAPTIATALGGPLAGMAVSALAGALGLEADAKETDVAAAMRSASPDQLLALKKADQAFAVRMRELDIDLEKLDQADRASARTREEKVGGIANPVIAGVVLSGFFAIAAAVIVGGAGADPATASIVGAVVGYASAKADQVVAYYFGSSAGSKRKTEAMAASLGGRGAGV